MALQGLSFRARLPRCPVGIVIPVQLLDGARGLRAQHVELAELAPARLSGLLEGILEGGEEGVLALLHLELQPLEVVLAGLDGLDSRVAPAAVVAEDGLECADRIVRLPLRDGVLEGAATWRQHLSERRLPGEMAATPLRTALCIRLIESTLELEPHAPLSDLGRLFRRLDARGGRLGFLARASCSAAAASCSAAATCAACAAASLKPSMHIVGCAAVSSDAR